MVSLAGEALGHHSKTLTINKWDNHIPSPNEDTEYLNTRPNLETETYAGRRDKN